MTVGLWIYLVVPFAIVLTLFSLFITRSHIIKYRITLANFKMPPQCKQLEWPIKFLTFDLLCAKTLAECVGEREDYEY